MKIADLVDVKHVITSVIIFIFLTSVLLVFFIIPTKKDLESTAFKIEKLKQKIEMHNQLFPVYLLVKRKIHELDKNIHVNPKKVALMEFKEQIFNDAPKFNLNILSITPEFKTNLLKSGLMKIKIDMNGKFIDCVRYMSFLLKEGYISGISYINMKSSVNKLDVELTFNIKV